MLNAVFRREVVLTYLPFVSRCIRILSGMSLKYTILWDQITPVFPAAIILSFLFAKEYTSKIKQVIGITHLQHTGKQTNLIRMGNVRKGVFIFVRCTNLEVHKIFKSPHPIKQHLHEKYHY